MTHAYLFLAIAIVAEVFATSCLKAADGFTRLLPSLGAVVGYCIAFYFLSLSLKDLPTGVAYAIWCGVGMLLVSLVSWLVFKQTLDAAAIGGMLLIGAGVALMNFKSSIAADS